MLVFLLSGYIMGTQVNVFKKPVEKSEELFIIEIEEKRDKWINIGTEADPGAGVSGVKNYYIYPHQADTSVYDSNLTEANAYSHFDATPGLNEPLEGYPPYDTAFDIVTFVQINYTNAYNSTGGFWDKNYTRWLITCSDLGISSDTVMSESKWISTSGNSEGDVAYLHFYDNNGGSGYTITHGQEVNVTSNKFQYWG